jgi:hypothetical protein
MMEFVNELTQDPVIKFENFIDHCRREQAIRLCAEDRSLRLSTTATTDIS